MSRNTSPNQARTMIHPRQQPHMHNANLVPTCQEPATVLATLHTPHVVSVMQGWWSAGASPDLHTTQRLLREAQYYQLTGLIDLLQQHEASLQQREAQLQQASTQSQSSWSTVCVGAFTVFVGVRIMLSV